MTIADTCRIIGFVNDYLEKPRRRKRPCRNTNAAPKFTLLHCEEWRNPQDSRWLSPNSNPASPVQKQEAVVRVHMCFILRRLRLLYPHDFPVLSHALPSITSLRHLHCQLHCWDYTASITDNANLITEHRWHDTDRSRPKWSKQTLSYIVHNKSYTVLGLNP
jgi:hypothetical protein